MRIARYAALAGRARRMVRVRKETGVRATTGATPELSGRGSLPPWPGPPDELRKGSHVGKWLFVVLGILCVALVVATVLFFLFALGIAYVSYAIFIKTWE